MVISVHGSENHMPAGRSVPSRGDSIGTVRAATDPPGIGIVLCEVRKYARVLSAAGLERAHKMKPSRDTTRTARRSVYSNHLNVAAISDTSYLSAQCAIASRFTAEAESIC